MSRAGVLSEVTLGVASTVWLVRLVLQLGPRAEVLEPAELKSVGEAAAGSARSLFDEPLSGPLLVSGTKIEDLYTQLFPTLQILLPASILRQET